MSSVAYFLHKDLYRNHLNPSLLTEQPHLDSIAGGFVFDEVFLITKLCDNSCRGELVQYGLKDENLNSKLLARSFPCYIKVLRLRSNP